MGPATCMSFRTSRNTSKTLYNLCYRQTPPTTARSREPPSAPPSPLICRSRRKVRRETPQLALGGKTAGSRRAEVVDLIEAETFAGRNVADAALDATPEPEGPIVKVAAFVADVYSAEQSTHPVWAQSSAEERQR